MIIHNGEKVKQPWKGKTEYVKIYKGEKLIYNRYAIPKEETVILSHDAQNVILDDIISNTTWRINL